MMGKIARMTMVPVVLLAMLMAFAMLTTQGAFAQEVDPTEVESEELELEGAVGEVLSAEIADDGSGTLVLMTPEDAEVIVTLTATDGVADYELKTPGATTPIT